MLSRTQPPLFPFLFICAAYAASAELLCLMITVIVPSLWINVPYTLSGLPARADPDTVATDKASITLSVRMTYSTVDHDSIYFHEKLILSNHKRDYDKSERSAFMLQRGCCLLSVGFRSNDCHPRIPAK